MDAVLAAAAAWSSSTDALTEELLEGISLAFRVAFSLSTSKDDQGAGQGQEGLRCSVASQPSNQTQRSPQAPLLLSNCRISIANSNAVTALDRTESLTVEKQLQETWMEHTSAYRAKLEAETALAESKTQLAAAEELCTAEGRESTNLGKLAARLQEVAAVLGYIPVVPAAQVASTGVGTLASAAEWSNYLWAAVTWESARRTVCASQQQLDCAQRVLETLTATVARLQRAVTTERAGQQQAYTEAVEALIARVAPPLEGSEQAWQQWSSNLLLIGADLSTALHAAYFQQKEEDHGTSGISAAHSVSLSAATAATTTDGGDDSVSGRSGVHGAVSVAKKAVAVLSFAALKSEAALRALYAEAWQGRIGEG